MPLIIMPSASPGPYPPGDKVSMEFAMTASARVDEDAESFGLLSSLSAVPGSGITLMADVLSRQMDEAR